MVFPAVQPSKNFKYPTREKMRNPVLQLAGCGCCPACWRLPRCALLLRFLAAALPCRTTCPSARLCPHLLRPTIFSGAAPRLSHSLYSAAGGVRWLTAMPKKSPAKKQQDSSLTKKREADAAPGGGEGGTTTGPANKKAKAPAKKKGRTSLERALTPRVQLAASAQGLKVISVNVAGLRSVLAQDGKRAALRAIVEKESPDVLCIQEHKLQEVHVEEASKGMAEILPGYSQHWTCSTEKKGYSGVATFVRGFGGTKEATKQPKTIQSFFTKTAGAKAPAATTSTPVTVVGDVLPGMGEANASDKIATSEGRLLTLELERLFVVNAYVPNSGQNLERLAYRTGTWDVNFNEYNLQPRAACFVWGGQ